MIREQTHLSIIVALQKGQVYLQKGDTKLDETKT